MSGFNRNISYTEDCLQAINKTFKFAHDKNYEFVTIDNLMAFIAETKMGRNIFEAMGLNPDEFRDGILKYLDENIPRNSDRARVRESTTNITIHFQEVLNRAAFIRASGGSRAVDEGYVILALLGEMSSDDSYTASYFEHYGVSQKDVSIFLKEGIRKSEAVKRKPSDVIKKDGYLAKYAVFLNELAEQGKIDPVIGRDSEIEKVITILAQRRKNNPILVGDPGVGKTAIAEGLAKKIIEGSVPEQIKDFMIYSLDLSSIVAGTKYRGDFEERMSEIIKEASGNANVVLFIDEIHTLIGAGSGSGSLDASNMLKPALSSGMLKVIGATTFDEHKSIFEKEGALARRFQKVDVAEPSVEDATKILLGLKQRYEGFHGVSYDDAAIVAAVDLTVKYISERRLPDKAIDVLDMAGAEVKLSGKKKRITSKTIAGIVAKMARIPISSMGHSEKAKLKHLEHNLKKEIYGQDDAISKIVDNVLLSRANLVSKDKPIGSFLFVGPSGVGKTELSKQLAAKLEIGFVRFDMSEYMEKHAVSKLIGAPPGYVGYEGGGQLVDAIKKHPHCVLLLDEIEKAHHDIYNVLLQVMDYGVLTDNAGNKADFKNVILIMTSNLGAAEAAKNELGFMKAEDEDRLKERSDYVKKSFSPEFYNRIDAVALFDSLSPESISKVIDKRLSNMKSQLAEHGVEISFSSKSKEALAANGYNKDSGARHMERYLENELSKPLAKEILFGRLVKGGKVKIDYVDGKIAFCF